jgi:hypothetical protein
VWWAYDYNSASQEAKEGGSQVQDQLRQQSKIPISKMSKMISKIDESTIEIYASHLEMQYDSIRGKKP